MKTDELIACLKKNDRGLRRVVGGIIGRPEDVPDVMQEIATKACLYFHDFREETALKNWLYRISHNEACNWIRKRGHRPQINGESDEEGATPIMFLFDKTPSPFDHTESTEVSVIVGKAIDKLPNVFKAAIVLRYLEDLSYEEVAAALGTNVGTVKSRLARAHEMLTETLTRSVEATPTRQWDVRSSFTVLAA